MAEDTRETDKTDQQPATFASLVMSLALGAMDALHASPATADAPARSPQPELAKPVIDMLEVLKEKTEGNLAQDETELLDSLLLELKVRYLRSTGKTESESHHEDTKTPGAGGSPHHQDTKTPRTNESLEGFTTKTPGTGESPEGQSPSS